MDSHATPQESRESAKSNGMCSSPQRRRRRSSSDEEVVGMSGFSKALLRHPPLLPANLLKRLSISESYSVGKVKVMLRVYQEEEGAQTSGDTAWFNLDKKRKQVTLCDPSLGDHPTPEDRRLGVAAPKMFAFDAIFSHQDPQAEISSSALADIVHAVINGTDGCLFCYGHPNLGQSDTMIGDCKSSSDLGIMPCAISWLYRSIAEQKQKSGARFSVRVSAIAIGSAIKDLLAGQANDGEQCHLRDSLLSGQALSQSELRAPTPEKAAHYLDCALAARQDAHLLFTLHVYQYSVASKGGVAGGRSRLHLLDLGCLNRSKETSCLSLSGIGNVLIAIFNGQKHLPHREHKLTQVLRECLSSLTCQAAMIAHVSPLPQHYPETLSTIQLASRIHRMRRRRPKYVNNFSMAAMDEASRLSGSSDVDPSSSEQSADTVIYLGHAVDETDGEHPPVYIPSLASGDNRPCLSPPDALKPSLNGERHSPKPPHLSDRQSPKPPYLSDRQSPKPPHLSDRHSPKPSDRHSPSGERYSLKDRSAVSRSVPNSPQRVPCQRIPTWLRSPLAVRSERAKSFSAKSSPVKKKDAVKVPPLSGEERWVDGPRISKSKVVEARNLHLLTKGGRALSGREMWVDGPLKPGLAAGLEPPGSAGVLAQGYGFMDSHKKSMIRQWVENQTQHIQSRAHTKGPFKELTVFKTCEDDDDDGPDDILNIERGQRGRASGQEDEGEEVQALVPQESPVTVSDSKVVQIPQLQANVEEDVDGEKPEPIQTDVEPKLTVEPIDDMEIEVVDCTEIEESVPMQDCCLQVTEEDIAKCMGEVENPLPEVDQDEHPLRILSQENLTIISSFTDPQINSMDVDRLFPPSGPFLYKNIANNPRPIKPLNSNENKFEQLSRLHELYRSKMGLMLDSSKKILNGGVMRCQSMSLSENLHNEADNHSLIETDFDNSSIVSEPAYLPGDASKTERICDNCRVSLCGFRDENGLWPPTRFQSFRPLLSSLRHPDGASNPNLRAEFEKREEKEEREPAEGAKEVDDDDEEEEMAVPPPLPNLLTLSRESFECLRPKHICDNFNRHMSNSCSKEQVHDPGGPVLHYCREDVQRLERGWNEARRSGRLRELKREQRQLMAELAAAKCRILFANPAWSKELSGI
ncbi:kinesin-like protein CG14535 isoform X3 [Bemisia tabaci]|uniref:kinesin-like protein CG14535 isoform X3 n=1 Tax=Bemisia tabaci TaxID=7038 RepID=UPI003B27BA24